MPGRVGGSSLKTTIQDSAMEIYRSFMPALRRCSSFKHAGAGWTASSAERRASQQQAENLKWQQDMFLRLINLTGLFQEGLMSESDVVSFRQKILDRIDVCLDGGEFPQVTRDKLLFLQELLYARCISEEEYHTVKRSLLYRLAAQGAEINATDIVLSCSAAAVSAPTSPVRERVKNAEATGDDGQERLSETQRKATKNKSPVKHLLEAMTRRKHSSRKVNTDAGVPHAMDLTRPKNCPAREPPEFDISDQCGSPLFHSPSGSVSTMESSSKAADTCCSTSRYKEERSPVKVSATRSLFPATSPSQRSPLSGQKASPGSGKSPLKPDTGSKVGNLLTDIIKKLHGEEEGPFDNDVEHETASSTTKKAASITANKQQELAAKQESTPRKQELTPKKQESTPKKTWRLDMLRPPKIATNPQDDGVAAARDAGSNDYPVLSPSNAPKDPVKVKKFHARGGSSDFYIDKVLGENIKKELEHIRSEISRTSSTQTFTRDQIDAIATRLPADKSELMRFFPKSWCDRYGDIVLDVVHKEFKGHIKDMETARKNAKDKRRENDENSGSNSNVENGAATMPSRAAAIQASETIKGNKSSRCFTTSDENSPRRAAKKVTSFNASVDRYEQELDGKLCAEIQRMPHRKTPLRV